MSANSTEPALKRVVTLLYVNLAISLVLAALTFLFKHNIIDYQLATMPSADQTAKTRQTLDNLLWIRPVSVLVVSIIYVRIASRLHLGKRSTYIRVLFIAIAGFLGLAYLVATAQFPIWMRACQVVQALVLLGLLFGITRPAVREHFRKTATPALAA